MTPLALGAPALARQPVRSGVRVLDDWTAFEAQAEPWTELGRAAAAGPFVSHDWLCAWWSAFGTGIAPRIVEVWRGGQLVAAAPLGIARRPLNRRVAALTVPTLHMLAGHRTAFNECLIAAGEAAAIEPLLDAVLHATGRWALADLEPLRVAPSLEHLVAAAGGRGLRYDYEEPIESLIADLANGWDAYLATRSKGVRRSVQRCRKRIGQTNPRILTARPGEDAILERALALSRRSWKGPAGIAFGARSSTDRFIRELWWRLGPKDLMDVTVLEIEGQDAGNYIAVRHDDTSYGLTIDFDEAFAWYWPGRFMFCHWLEAAATRGMRRADFLRRNSYLDTYTEHTYRIARLRLYPRQGLPFLWRQVERRLRPIGRAARRQRRLSTSLRAAFRSRT